MHMVFGSSFLAWFGFIFILSYVVSLAKLLLFFILEKRYVLIEMLLVLSKIAAHIHFIYHVQAQKLVFNSAEKDNSNASPQSAIERNLKYPEFRVAPNYHHRYYFSRSLEFSRGLRY